MKKNIWDIQSIYNSEKEFYNSLKEFERDLMVLDFSHCKIAELKEIFATLNLYLQNLDSYYTFCLLNMEKNVLSNIAQDMLDRINQTYQLFEKQTIPLQHWLDMNEKEILTEIQANPELYRYKKFFLSELIEDEKETNRVNLMDRINIAGEYDKYFAQYNLFGYITVENIFYHEPINNENLLSLLYNSNNEVRKIAYITVLEFLEKHSQVAATMLNTHYQLTNYCYDNNYFEKLIKKSTINFDFLLNECSKEKKKFNVIFQRLINQKKNNLNLNTITYYDMYAYNIKDEPFLSIEEAENIIKRFAEGLPESFKNIIQKEVFDNNWIDWKLSNTKRSGARSFSYYEHHPFITINWQGTLDNLFGLVHEIGGALSQYFASKHQVFIYSEPSTFKVEFLSFLLEFEFMDFLMNEKDILINFSKEGKILDELKDMFFIPLELTMIENQLSNIASSQHLTRDIISDVYISIVDELHMNTNFDELPINRYNWIKIKHLYYPGYNLKYIESFIIMFYFFCKNKKLANIEKILNKGESITDKKFIEMLEIPDIENKDFFFNVLDMISNFMEGLQNE